MSVASLFDGCVNAVAAMTAESAAACCCECCSPAADLESAGCSVAQTAALLLLLLMAELCSASCLPAGAANASEGTCACAAIGSMVFWVEAGSGGAWCVPEWDPMLFAASLLDGCVNAVASMTAESAAACLLVAWQLCLSLCLKAPALFPTPAVLMSLGEKPRQRPWQRLRQIALILLGCIVWIQTTVLTLCLCLTLATASAPATVSGRKWQIDA